MMTTCQVTQPDELTQWLSLPTRRFDEGFQVVILFPQFLPHCPGAVRPREGGGREGGGVGTDSLGVQRIRKDNLFVLRDRKKSCLKEVKSALNKNAT